MPPSGALPRLVIAAALAVLAAVWLHRSRRYEGWRSASAAAQVVPQAVAVPGMVLARGALGMARRWGGCGASTVMGWVYTCKRAMRICLFVAQPRPVAIRKEVHSDHYHVFLSPRGTPLSSWQVPKVPKVPIRPLAAFLTANCFFDRQLQSKPWGPRASIPSCLGGRASRALARPAEPLEPTPAPSDRRGPNASNVLRRAAGPTEGRFEALRGHSFGHRSPLPPVPLLHLNNTEVACPMWWVDGSGWSSPQRAPTSRCGFVWQRCPWARPSASPPALQSLSGPTTLRMGPGPTPAAPGACGCTGRGSCAPLLTEMGALGDGSGLLAWINKERLQWLGLAQWWERLCHPAVDAPPPPVLGPPP